MIRTYQYRCLGSSGFGAALALLGGITLPATTSRLQRSVLDTFDGRLARAGLVLIRDWQTAGGMLYLRQSDGRQLASARIGDPEIAPATAFAERRVRQQLSGLIGVRVLLVAAQWPLERSTVDYRDADGKMLGNIACEQHSAAADSILILCATPKRGYGREFRAILAPWSQDAQLERCTQDFNLTLARRLGTDPQAYRANARIKLDPDDDAHRALARLLSAYRDIMRSNEQGIIDDIDSEFLHDFRVAMRRSRSVLSAFRSVAGPCDDLKAGFRWLSALSGPARDFDVWLLEPHGEDEALLRFVSQARKVARQSLVRALKSARYRRFQDHWSDWLEQLEGGHERGSRRALVPFASRAIARCYGKLRRSIKKHRQRMDMTTLHELRKEAKKLRYLLEASQSLYPRDEMKVIMRELRTLQSEAGRVCDRHARLVNLRAWLEGELDEDTRGALSAALDAYAMPEQLDLKHPPYTVLGKTLRRFADRDNARHFKGLFGHAGS